MKHPMLSSDGFIVNQSCACDAPYGKYASAHNGCGWMAAYNVLHALRGQNDWQAVCDALHGGLHFGGRLGTGPRRMQRYLASFGLCAKMGFTSYGILKKSAQCKAGILLYFTPHGAHYVAFLPTQTAKTYRFFNAESGNENHLQTLPQFCKTQCQFPVILGIFML